MILSKQQIQATYQSRAKYYDFAVQLYRLIGIRQAYRSRAVELLRLQEGDCVVELGCGTGLNFPLILDKIGSEGRLIGVDLAARMLACARERADRYQWKNVELVESDMAVYDFPEGVNKVLAIGVFGYVAEYDRVIKAASQALAPGGRLVIMDGKLPEHWPSSWLVKLMLWLSRPFGVNRDYVSRHPWKSVEHHFEDTGFEEMYGGGMYISHGAAPHRPAE